MKIPFNTSSTRWEYTSPTLRYSFRPDPTATFNAAGLSGNRPLFIVPGVARDTIFPDRMVINFTAMPSEAHDVTALLYEVERTFRDAGVSVGGTGYSSTGPSPSALLLVDGASRQSAAIAKALEMVRVQYAGRVSRIIHWFEFDPMRDAQPTVDQTFSESRRFARRLAQIAGTDLEQPMTSSLPHIFVNAPDPNWQFPDLTRALPYDRPVVLDQTATVSTRLTVVTEARFTGTRPVEWQESQAALKLAARAFRADHSWYLPPLDPQAEIAADRPEIFVTAATSSEAAFRTGIDPYFAAAQHAWQRTTDVARTLGVQIGSASLFAPYPGSEDDDVRTLGFAATFSGGDIRRWRKIPADKSVTAYSGNDPRRAAIVPISVPDKANTIEETSDAELSAPTEALRINVQFNNAISIGGDRNDLTMQADRAIRRLPYVLDVASAAVGGNGSADGYEIVVSGVGRARPEAILETLRRFYASPQIRADVNVSAISLHCAALETRLLKATTRLNAINASADALHAGKTIRKPLLVVVYPADAWAACDSHAHAPPTEVYPPSQQMASSPSVHMALSSTIVFRTFASAATR